MSAPEGLFASAQVAARLRAQLGRLAERVERERGREAQLQRDLEAERLALAGEAARGEALEQEAARLAAQLAGLQRLAPTGTDRLAAALGRAADAIQLGVTGLRNPTADFALAELNVELRGALRMGDGGASAQIAFPEGEGDDPNTARIRAKLRPRPKRTA